MPAGWQSMKYSAISDCGSDEHSVSSPSTASGPESSTVTHGALVLVDVELLDRARGHARDLDLASGDQAERVVHLELVGVRVVGAGDGRDAAGAGGKERQR